MNNINNYWNIFAATGSIDDYMTYKKIEQLNKINIIEKIEPVAGIKDKNNNFFKK